MQTPCLGDSSGDQQLCFQVETRGEAGEHGTWEREQQSSVAGGLVLASFSNAKTENSFLAL